MEISKSINFIMEDPRWQTKLMIGTGVIIASTILSAVLIGFIGFIIFAGYCVRLLQNVRDGQPYPMPEWDQWGEDLARGFKLVIASIVWALPIIILIIPSIIGGALTESRNDSAQFIGVMLLICGQCLTFIYGLLLAVVTPGISIAFAKHERINSALQFREIIAWTRENIGQVLVVTIVIIAASFALSLVGLIAGLLLCLVGVIITIPLATLLAGLFQYHLYGQLAYAAPFPGGSFSGGSSPSEPSTTSYATPSDIAPGITPLDPADTPVGDSADYPDSGVDNPAPPPAG